MKSTELPALMHAMTDAQTEHSVMALLSLVPILAAFKLGGWLPFFMTSFLCFFFELAFVMIQRYNRARLSLILQKKFFQTDEK